MCRQEALLALRRSVLPCVPIRSKRKLELIADIAPECDTPAKRQRIFAEVLFTWFKHELRLLIARLRGLGYMVPVTQRPRSRLRQAAHCGQQRQHSTCRVHGAFRRTPRAAWMPPVPRGCF